MDAPTVSAYTPDGYQEVPEMSEQIPAPHKKACLCAIKPLRGPLYAATGKTNAQGQSEFKCRLCGASEWR